MIAVIGKTFFRVLLKLDRVFSISQNKLWECFRRHPTRQKTACCLNYTICSLGMGIINTLRPIQNGSRFPDGIVKCIFLNENVWTPLKISLKFVPKVRINNIPAWVQIMAWCQPGDKPLSELRMASLLTHICVTRPQWVKPISSIPLFQIWWMLP